MLSKATVVDTDGKPVDVSALTSGILDGEDDFETSDAASLLEQANAGAAPGKGKAVKDGHGRKPGNEHYGHDHS